MIFGSCSTDFFLEQEIINLRKITKTKKRTIKISKNFKKKPVLIKHWFFLIKIGFYLYPLLVGSVFNKFGFNWISFSGIGARLCFS